MKLPARSRGFAALAFVSLAASLFTGAPAIAGVEGSAKKDAALEDLPFTRWGVEILERIDKDLSVGNLYAEWGTPDGKRHADHGQLSYVWPASFQLRALASAARLEPRAYQKKLIAFASSLDTYWSARRGHGAYAVVPGSTERFYDDNAWMLLGLLDTYEATRQKKFYERAQQVLAFLEAGEKETKGGGICQKEGGVPGGIFTCTAAPAAVGALRLYLIRKDPKLLEFAERMHAALTSKEIGLRDGNGLYHQWARLEDNGRWHVERGTRAYQTALPIELEVLLYRIKKDDAHLEEARRMAEASISRWIRDDGTLAEAGQWGGSDLCDAFLDLYEVDENPRWLEVARKFLLRIHDARDPGGRYPEEWSESRADRPLEKFHLLFQAPVARAYWRAAAYEPERVAKKKKSRARAR